MSRSFVTVVSLVIAGLVAPLAAQAESKVKVSETHLCCGACVKAVNAALKDIQGVKHTADQDEGTIAITAADDAGAQAALDALLSAGFHGKIDNPALKFKETKVAAGNVQRIELTGVHNCCGSCTKSIKEAIKSVDGVTADTVKPKQSSFVVEGNFDAAKLVAALLDAGFAVQVKK
jgi:copper chaperone CopZ